MAVQTVQSVQTNPNFQIKHRQLAYILDRLVQLHKGSGKYDHIFRQAKESLDQLDIKTAAFYIQPIIYEKTISEDLRQKHESILEEAKSLGNNYTIQMSDMNQVLYFLINR